MNRKTNSDRLANTRSRRAISKCAISRRTLGLGIASSALLGACATDRKFARLMPKVNIPKVNIPMVTAPPRDEFNDAYAACRGAPLCKFADMTLPAPDGFPITIRLSYPAVVTSRLPVIVGATDYGDDAVSYDMLSGGIASRGYVVLAVSASGNLVEAQDGGFAGRNTRRAQRLSYVLDNLRKVIAIMGRDAEMVETSQIGIAGYGEGAWTALGFVGWGRGLVPNSALADGRCRSCFALAPSLITSLPQLQDRSIGRVIYGRTLIAADSENMPDLPEGSGVIGVGLPPFSAGFGGMLGRRQAGRGRGLPQREILAAACASASLFFDWSLKGDKSKLDQLMASNGRRLDGLNRPISITRV